MKTTIARKIANIKDWHYVIAEYKYTHSKEIPKWKSRWRKQFI